MNISKRFLSILLFAAISVGAWALDQDADGYYLIGSVQDWKDFATLVQTTPASYNAKLMSDVDLGTEQTMLGSIEQPYSGTFDGQGFTLTVHLNNTVDGVAPFRRIDNTTIKNLAVAGSVTGDIHSSGLVGGVPENSEYNLISNVMVSTTITTTGSHCGGILGHGGSTTNTTIQDCLFNGTINGKSGGSTVGVIWGWQTYGQANITNCLENGTYTNTSSFNPVFLTASGPANVANTYYVTGSSTYGTQATSETLADGTVTNALNNDRTGDDAPWIQDPVTNQPMLKIFASLKQDADGYYLIGSVQDWKNFATLVETTPTANAKMTADIDLSTDVTMVGTESIPYQGTFDGQGHKLTVNWSVNGGGNGVAPFRYVSGATIQKLHVDGNISATGSEQRGAASIVAFSIGSTTTTINECWGSVSLTCYDTMGGLFSVAFETSTVNITDCLFSGTINPTHSGQGFSAGFASQAMRDGSKGPTINITRGLFLGSYDGSSIYCYTFIRNDLPDEFGTHNITDCYYKDAYGTAQGTQVTLEQLSNGITTAALNGERTGDNAPWIQDSVTNQPMLAVFVANNSGISTGEAIQVSSYKLQVTSDSWYSISGQKLSGKPSAKGIYINNGKKIVVN